MDFVSPITRRKRVSKRLLFLIGLTLVALTMSLELLLSKTGHEHYRWPLATWIMNVSLAVFVVSTGTVFHDLVTFGQKNWISYFVKRRGLPSVLKYSTDILTGFCLPWIVFPFWLGIREGTIDCLGNRSCVNTFSTKFILPSADLICLTPRFGYKGHDLGLCETLCYTLPLVLFSSIPVFFAVKCQALRK